MLSLSLALVLTVAVSAPGDGLAIVVHPASRLDTVSRTELSKIFLGRLRTWSDGSPAVPVDQLPDRPVRERFSRQILGRSVVNVEVYWKRMIFSGRGIPPDELRDDQQVLEFVRRTPGAVGYVDAATAPTGVRRLALQE